MLARLRDIVFLRYLVASALALAVDMGSFLALLAMGSRPAVAAMGGYGLGIVTHWLLSSRTVFVQGVAARGPERNRQKALFVGSALVGLALTTLIVGNTAAAGLDPRIGKVLAIGVSFVTTWLLRERIVFRQSEARG